MSQADNLLNTLAVSMGQYEEHIIIDLNRNITVPAALKRIAVQYDHNVETVTFDCPRYWDDWDFSKMHIYINYELPDGTKDEYIADGICVDDVDANVIHFSWTISRNVTQQKGKITFLVCIKHTDENGEEYIHWNSEKNEEMHISEGLEGDNHVVVEQYPDVINGVLTRMDAVEELAEEVDEIVEAIVIPEVAIEDTEEGATVTVTDTNGTTTAFIENGKDRIYVGSGDMPEGYYIQIDPDGDLNLIDASIEVIPVDVLPTEDIKTSAIYMVPIESAGESNAYAEYLYINGTWERIGTTSVGADLSEYVKRTDYATETKTGVIKVSTWGGTRTDPSGTISIIPASNSAINNKSAVGMVKDSGAITPSNLDYAVKKALADSKLADTVNAWTDDEKVAARTLIGAVGDTDYATQNKAGLVRAYSAYGTLVNANGIMYADNRTLAQYQKDSTAMFIGKGTLENIKNTYVKEGLTTNTETLTPEEKAKAQAWLGIPKTITSIDCVGSNTFNYPVYLDATKTYNAALLFEYAENGYTDRTVKYFENVAFVDGALRLSIDDAQLVGAIIFANQFYDANEDTYTDKSGWVRVESDMEVYSNASYKYSITLTEA